MRWEWNHLRVSWNLAWTLQSSNFLLIFVLLLCRMLPACWRPCPAWTGHYIRPPFEDRKDAVGRCEIFPVPFQACSDGTILWLFDKLCAIKCQAVFLKLKLVLDFPQPFKSDVYVSVFKIAPWNPFQCSRCMSTSSKANLECKPDPSFCMPSWDPWNLVRCNVQVNQYF